MIDFIGRRIGKIIGFVYSGINLSGDREYVL